MEVNWLQNGQIKSKMQGWDEAEQNLAVFLTDTRIKVAV